MLRPTPRFMETDVIIIGAGGAGMMCAIHAGSRGKKVLLLDHAQKLGGKILISGGGRCNFTNTGASALNYVSNNSHFAKSALSRYEPEKFIEMVRARGIAFHEKKLGQLFCDGSAREIVGLLQAECEKVEAQFKLGTKIEKVSRIEGDPNLRFEIITSHGSFKCQSLVIATGGLSIPKIGATGLGYELAREFGLKLVETAAALDGFTFGDAETRSLRELAGLSIDCKITSGGVSFRENILFTHSGLSGPAALQASLHWRVGENVEINLLPETEAFPWFMAKKREGNRQIVKNLLGELLPNRFADRFAELYFSHTQPLPQVSEKLLAEFCDRLHAWKLTPIGTVGYSKAEVTRGGVDTDELSSKTLESKRVPGLYFIGEVVDVTGWLGGYNFQWAWASGYACGMAL